MSFGAKIQSFAPMPKSYVDLVAYISMMLSVPFILLSAIFTALPTFLWVFLSYTNRCDTLSYMVWYINHNFIAFPINSVEKIVIYAVSFLLYPIGYFVYGANNQNIIDFIRMRTGSEKIKYRGMTITMCTI